MPWQTIRFTLAAFGLICISSGARGQAVDARNDKSDQQQFVVGDWYQLSIKRDDFKIPDGQGLLLKATDDWVVIGFVLSEGGETGVPRLRDLPYVGAWFGSSWYQEAKCYTWIPRNLVHIDKHEPHEAAAIYRKVFADGVPALGKECSVHVVKDNQPTSIDGDFVGIKDGQVLFTKMISETSRTLNPKWGRLPLIGSSFTEEHVVVHTVEKNVPFNDVLYIHNLVKMTPAEMHSLAQDTKVAMQESKR